MKNKTIPFKIMVNVDTCEDEDILYDYQEDFTIWDSNLFYVWFISFLDHKLCELVQTLVASLLIQFCRKKNIQTSHRKNLFLFLSPNYMLSQL